MNRKENAFKKYLVRIMGTRWHVQSHEDKYSVGIPDLSYAIAKCDASHIQSRTNGWIELKYITSWNGDKPVKPKKYTPNQVNWLNKRNKRGGNCYVFVQIGNEYYLLSAVYAKAIKKGMTKQEYDERFLLRFNNVIEPDVLAKMLTRNHH